MRRLDDLKKLRQAAAKAAGDAVVGAADVIQGAEAVAARSGLTSKDGDISKLRLARAAMRPAKSARTVVSATVDEVTARREQSTPVSAD